MQWQQWQYYELTTKIRQNHHKNLLPAVPCTVASGDLAVAAIIYLHKNNFTIFNSLSSSQITFLLLESGTDMRLDLTSKSVENSLNRITETARETLYSYKVCTFTATRYNISYVSFATLVL